MGWGLWWRWGVRSWGHFLSLGCPTNFFSLFLPTPPPDPFSLSHLFFPHFFFLLFLIPPATRLPGLPFMSVLGTSLVGVLISALPRYFCLRFLSALPPPPSISNSAWFSISCVCLVSWWLWGLSLSSWISFHLPLSVQLSHHSYLWPPYLSLCLISLGCVSLSLSL